MKIIHIVTILLLSIIINGCASNERIDEQPLLTNSIISMNEFSRNNGLSVDTVAGGYLFSKAGVRLQIYPNIKYLKYNGKTFEVPEAPFVSEGELFFPISLIESLPDSFNTSRKVIIDRFVLIDPGHGGEDTGAISGSVLEKDIALDISRRVQSSLASNGIQSKLTRSGDYFITLDERSRIANSYPGALFVSIHVNAESSGGAEGIETYYLSSKISDRQRAEWAATEYDFNTVNGSLSPAVEISTATKISHNLRDESKSLAQSVQRKIIQNMREKSRGVKQANFSVLRESFFGPAILIETGFITHDATKMKLIKPEYRQQLADNITQGITEFITK